MRLKDDIEKLLSEFSQTVVFTIVTILMLLFTRLPEYIDARNRAVGTLTPTSTLCMPTQTSTRFYLAQKVVQPVTATPRSTEIPATPTPRVRVSPEIVLQLAEISSMGEEAAQKLHWYDEKWTSSFYAKLERLVEDSPVSLRADVSLVRDNFLIGIELMDESKIREALLNLKQVQSRVY